MKRYVATEPIYGMAYDRNKIKSRAIFYSDDIAEHIMKCIIYSREHKDYNHWIEEISEWIFKISDMAPKKGFKIKNSDYQSWLLNGFGDEQSDMRKDLEFFRDKFVVKHKEPFKDFDITLELCENLFDIITNINNKIIPMMQKYESVSEVNSDLHSILDKICISTSWIK